MKKKFLVAALALAGILTVVGCGQSEATEGDTQTTASGEATSVAVEDLPDIDETNYLVKLADYKSIEIESALMEITEADVEATISQALEASVTTNDVEGRTLESGDIANINYAGKMNGEAFEGGTDDSESGYDLEIGSNSFIPGFEDALVGMEIGETRDIDLVFPEQYYEELAGKPVVFTVTLNGIKEKVYPELNDEYAQAQGLEGVSTVSDLRAYVKDMLEKNAQYNYENDLSTEIMNKLVDQSEFANGIPKEKYQKYYDKMYASDEAIATDYGLQLEGYVMYNYGFQDLNQYMTALKDYAEKSVKMDAVIKSLLENESKLVTDEDVEKSIEEKYADFGCESVDEFKEQFEVEEYKAYLENLKVVEIVKEYAGVK